jgi:hypothetical protein
LSTYNIVPFKEFAVFAAQQSELLEAFAQQRETELSETDLVAFVERHRNREGAGIISTSTVVRKLKELRVIEEMTSGDSGGTYRYSDTIAGLHDYLAQTLDPVSPESIAGAIESLQKLVKEMDQACRDYSATTVDARAREMRQRSTQVLKGVEANYRHILNEAAAIRQDSRGMTATERFIRLERAWTTYIQPLVEIINVRGQIERVLRLAEAAVERAEEDGYLVQSRSDATLRRFVDLRQRSNSRILDCIQTIRPILEKHRQESLAASGAALIVERLLRNGVENSGIDALTPIQWIVPRDRFTDEQILSCARNVEGIVPEEPPVIDLRASHDIAVPDYGNPAFIVEVIDALKSAGDVPDVWSFIRERFPGRSALHCLAAFYNLQSEVSGSVVDFTGDIKDYEFPECRLTAGIVSVSIPSPHERTASS